MAGFTPVTSMIRNELPDYIGVDQLKRKNALADQQAMIARQGAETDQMNAQSYRAQLDAQTQARSQQVSEQQAAQAREWLGNAVQTVRQNPALIPALVREGKMRGVLTGEIPDNITPEQVEEFALRYGIAPAQQPVTLSSQRVGGFNVLRDSTGKVINSQAPERAGGGGNEPIVIIQTPNGPMYVPRSQAIGQAPAAPKDGAVPSEGERTAGNYLSRMQAAEQLLGNYQPDVKDYFAAQRSLEGGSVSSPLANSMMSGEGQQFYQAASDWVRAKLRKESGAVIAPSEMIQEIRTYFPVPGDKPETIRQKEQARRQAEAGMRMMAGRSGGEGPSAPAAPNGIPGIDAIEAELKRRKAKSK